MFFKSAWPVTFINAAVVRWLDGKCQRLLATALKVQHCWTLKTTVGDCWRQSPTCAGDSRQLKYKHARDCRRLSLSRATVGDWSINQALMFLRKNQCYISTISQTAFVRKIQLICLHRAPVSNYFRNKSYGNYRINTLPEKLHTLYLSMTAQWLVRTSQ